RPFGCRPERRDDVDALAAGDHGEAFEAPFGERGTDIERRLPDGFEIEAFVGVDVENDAVGLFELVDMAAPDVEFEAIHLDASDDAREPIDVEIVFDRAVLFL